MMDAKTQQGYLILADISGYVPFMAGTELEHSHEIMAELLELIVSRLTPVLTLASLEGDAVLAYAPQARLPRGETLLELVEAAYVAFKDRLKNIRRNNTCECRACLAAHTLDLKFIVHSGEFLARRAEGGYELTGLAVNLVRQRLLKNAVSEATGWRGYVTFTEDSLARLGVRPEGGHAQAGTYEHVGEVKTYSLDLQARYRELTDARRTFLEPDKADVVLTHDFPAPPPVVWEWLNEPHKRTRWQTGRVWSAGARPAGRSGPGARNHCAHRTGAILETVLDWRPFDYFTVEMVQRPVTAISTLQLEPLLNGRMTRLHMSLKLQLPLPGWVRRRLGYLMFTRAMNVSEMYAKMARLIVEAAARAPEAQPSSAGVD